MTDFAAKVSISVEELWKRNRYAANLIVDFHSPQTLWGKLRLRKGHTRVATINSPLVPMVCGYLMVRCAGRPADRQKTYTERPRRSGDAGNTVNTAAMAVDNIDYALCWVCFEILALSFSLLQLCRYHPFCHCVCGARGDGFFYQSGCIEAFY